MTNYTTVLGFDQAPEVTGFAFKLQDDTIAYDIITAPSPKKCAKLGLTQSLWMVREIIKLIEQVRPEAVALEGLFLGKNPRTLMDLAEFRGMLLWICHQRSTPVITVTSPDVMRYLGLSIGTPRDRKKQRSQFMATVLIHGQAYASDGANKLIDHNAADAVVILEIAEARWRLERMVAEA